MIIGPAVMVALVLALTALSSVPATAAPRDDCEVVKTVPVPGDGQHAVVPVIVRFMKNKNPNFARDPEEQLSIEEVESFFDSGGTINTIWRRANVSLALHRIERCPYAVHDLGFDQGFKIPSPKANDWAGFFRVNELYNFGDFGLDVYIWWGIKFGMAFAAPHRVDGMPRKGAVWLGSNCLNAQTVTQCETLIAHEAGHFFGLCHVCTITGDDPPSRGPSALCHTCQSAVPNCQGMAAPRNRLMRADANGTTLSRAEKACALGKARERVQP